MKDRDIIRGCQKGRERAFRQLVDTYASMLMGVCLRYMKERAKAEDVLQETLIHVFQNINQFSGKGSFAGWLRRIAVTTSLKALRSRKLDLVELEEETMNNGTEIEPDIDQHYELEEILELINRIPDHYRIVFMLYIVEGYQHHEIAEMLEIKESNSRARLTRARMLVRDAYTKKNLTYEASKARKVYTR